MTGVFVASRGDFGEKGVGLDALLTPKASLTLSLYLCCWKKIEHCPHTLQLGRGPASSVLFLGSKSPKRTAKQRKAVSKGGYNGRLQGIPGVALKLPSPGQP